MGSLGGPGADRRRPRGPPADRSIRNPGPTALRPGPRQPGSGERRHRRSRHRGSRAQAPTVRHARRCGVADHAPGHEHERAVRCGHRLGDAPPGPSRRPAFLQPGAACPLVEVVAPVGTALPPRPPRRSSSVTGRRRWSAL
jgi:hypothetical protein